MRQLLVVDINGVKDEGKQSHVSFQLSMLHTVLLFMGTICYKIIARIDRMINKLVGIIFNHIKLL